MKGKNSNIEAHCGFIPSMSSATRDLLCILKVTFPYVSCMFR